MLVASRMAAAQFLREFDEDQPLSLGIAPVARNSQPRISELAVRTLALTESIPALVKTLSEVNHEESLDAAIDGLRNWLGLSPENGKTLKEELGKAFRSQDADVIYRLLWGFSAEDAQNRDVSLQLVAHLEHDQLAVRELAFYYVYRFTGQKFNYRAGLLPVRRSTVAAVRSFVEKHDGLSRKSVLKKTD